MDIEKILSTLTAKRLPEPSPDTNEKLYKIIQKLSSQDGIVKVLDFLVDYPDFPAFLAFAANQVSVSLSLIYPKFNKALQKATPANDPSEVLL